MIKVSVRRNHSRKKKRLTLSKNIVWKKYRFLFVAGIWSICGMLYNTAIRDWLVMYPNRITPYLNDYEKNKMLTKSFSCITYKGEHGEVGGGRMRRLLIRACYPFFFTKLKSEIHFLNRPFLKMVEFKYILIRLPLISNLDYHFYCAYLIETIMLHYHWYIFLRTMHCLNV